MATFRGSTQIGAKHAPALFAVSFVHSAHALLPPQAYTFPTSLDRRFSKPYSVPKRYAVVLLIYQKRPPCAIGNLRALNVLPQGVLRSGRACARAISTVQVLQRASATACYAGHTALNTSAFSLISRLYFSKAPKQTTSVSLMLWNTSVYASTTT